MAAGQLAPLGSSLNSQRSASLLLDPVPSAGSPFPRLGQLGEGAVTPGAAVTKWGGSPGQPPSGRASQNKSLSFLPGGQGAAR